MQIVPETGLLLNTRFLASENCNERPPGMQIDLLVIHGISLPPKQFGGPYIDALFTNQLDVNAHPYFAEIAQIKVSAHCLIARNGQVTQYVPFGMRAWHAGRSHFQGRENCNDFSIGIELEGADDVPYAQEQYEKLAEMIILLKTTYPEITDERVVGHDTVAPGRKTDPGPAFDWQLLKRLLVRE